MRRFLAWLSGAYPDVLKRFPSDRARYEAIGGAVLTTAAIAALSCGFALQMAIQAPLPVCVVIALGWGLMIMNLDRWLVSSIQKEEKWYQNLLVALPRLVLAILIGTIISTPLVLRVFQPEIDRKLVELQQERRDQFFEERDKGERAQRIAALESLEERLHRTIDRGASVDPAADREVMRLRTQRDELQRRVDKTREDLVCELAATCGTGRSGDGPVANALRANLLAFENELERIDSQLAARISAVSQRGTARQKQAVNTAKEQLVGVQKELATLKQQQDSETANFEKTTASSDGLLERLEALDLLVAENRTLLTAQLLLLLFITVIECLPVLVKFLQSLGPRTTYERAMELEQNSRLEVERVRVDVWRVVASFDAQNALPDAIAGMEGRDEVTNQIATATARIQSQIAQIVLTSWRDRQVQREQHNVDLDDTPGADRTTLGPRLRQRRPHLEGSTQSSQAAALHIRELAREARLGPDQPGTARNLSDLAITLTDQGDLHTAESLTDLAHVLADAGDYEQAHALLERALGIREARLGPDHPGTARSLSDLAAVLANQGKSDQARSLRRRAESILSTSTDSGLFASSTSPRGVGAAQRSDRVVTVWIKDAEPPLRVGQSYRLGVKIGTKRHQALVAAPIEKPEAQARKSLDIIIAVHGSNWEVQPTSRRALLPARGETGDLYFDMRPLVGDEKLTIIVTIQLARSLSLLDELEANVEVLGTETVPA